MPRLTFILLVVVGSCVATWLFLPKVEYLPGGNRNLVIAILLPPPGYNLEQLLSMGNVVEEGLKPYWDIDPASPEAKKLDAPPIEDFFFVARNRQVFVGVRSAIPERAAELVPVIQQLGEKFPGTILVAKQTSLFEQGLTAGRTVDVEITGPDINKLVALGGRMFGQIGALLDETQARRDGTSKEGEPPPRQTHVFPQPSLDLSNPEIWIVP